MNSIFLPKNFIKYSAFICIISLCAMEKEESASISALPDQYRILYSSSVDLLTYLPPVKKSALTQSELHKEYLAMLLGEKPVHPPYIFNLLNELVRMLDTGNNLKGSEHRNYKERIRKDNEKYYQHFYFDKGVTLQREASDSIETARHSSSTNFYTLVFYYHAQTKLNQASEAFEEAARYNKSKEENDGKLMEISLQLEDLQEKVVPLVDPQIIKQSNVTYSKAEELKEHFKQLPEIKSELLKKQKEQIPTKKLKKEEKQELLAKIKKIFDAEENELNSLNKLSEDRIGPVFYRQQQLQQSVEGLKKMLENKKFHLMRQKLHEIEVAELKKDYLVKLDVLENDLLKAAKDFLILFKENPQHSYIKGAEQIMAQAALIGSEKYTYSPHFVTIKQDVSTIWHSIKVAEQLLENPKDNCDFCSNFPIMN